MSAVMTMTQDTFDGLLTGTPTPILVDFWAEGCAPCQALTPLLDRLAAQDVDRLRVGTVRLDDNPALAARFEIRTLPTLILFINARPTTRLTGIRSFDELDQKVQASLGGNGRRLCTGNVSDLV